MQQMGLLGHLGVGLMGATGPRQGAWGRGVSQGLLMNQRARQEQQELQRQQEMDNLRKQQAEMALRQQQQQMYESHRRAAEDAAQKEYLKRYLEDPTDMAALAKAAPTQYAQAQIASQFAKPKDDRTSGIKEYEFAKTQGYKGTFQQYQADMKKAGAANTTINMPAHQKPLGTDAVKFVNKKGENPSAMMSVEQAVTGGYQPIAPHEQAGQTAAATKQAGENVVKNEALQQATGLIQDYKNAFDATGTLDLTAHRGVASAKRDALVAWVAQNILGTPGAEPSDKIVKRAEAMVPDFSGIVDRAQYRKKMQGLEDTIASKLGGKKDEAADPLGLR